MISYSYLWRREADRGREEGRKNRPCAVVIALKNGRVAVAPITHSQPLSGTEYIELPQTVKAQLGLDDQRSWLITNELNQFDWPGYDIRPVDRSPSGRVVYGELPPSFFKRVTDAVAAQARKQSLGIVDRN